MFTFSYACFWNTKNMHRAEMKSYLQREAAAIFFLPIFILNMVCIG